MSKPLNSKTEQKLRDGRATTNTERHTQSTTVPFPMRKPLNIKTEPNLQIGDKKSF